jgi:pimeloyl-ACP methyl ester carboxylesterase
MMTCHGKARGPMFKLLKSLSTKLPVYLTVILLILGSLCLPGNASGNEGSSTLTMMSAGSAAAVTLRGGLRILKSVAFIVFASYVGLMLLMFVFQSRYVYYPSNKLVAEPRDIGLEYEDLMLDTRDGGKINAWFVPAPSGRNRGCILFCHGNAGNISHRLSTIEMFHDLGFATLIFDYRGYGRSTGRPSEKNTYADAAAAWDYLTAPGRYRPEQVVVFGRSLGGAVAAWLAAEKTPGMLIIESTFTSLPQLGQQVYPYLPVKLLARIRYNTLERLQHVACPVVIVHSPDDDLIPFSHGEALFEAALEPKLMVTLAGGHNTTMEATGAAYGQKLDDAVRQLLEEPGAGGPATGSQPESREPQSPAAANSDK